MKGGHGWRTWIIAGHRSDKSQLTQGYLWCRRFKKISTVETSTGLALEVCILHARHSCGNPQSLQHWGLVGCLPVCRDSPSAETSQQIGYLANLGDMGSKRFSMDLSQQTPTMQPVERSNLRNGKTDNGWSDAVSPTKRQISAYFSNKK